MLKNGYHCTSPQSIDFAVTEVKKYDEVYNVHGGRPELSRWDHQELERYLVEQGQKVRNSRWSIILL